MKKFINHILIVLIVTNIWVFLYIYLLRFLNNHFPPPPATNFIFGEVLPEPFEIPLYLLLSLIFILLVFLFSKYLKQPFLTSTNGTILKLLFSLYLLRVFIQGLGSYPMKNEVYPYIERVNPNTVNIVFGLYIATIIFILFQLITLNLIFKKNRGFINLIYIFITIVIAILIFEPRFPISWHDYSYFIGPILEIAHGKTIYTQIQSQYGFLSILTLAFLYKWHLFNLPWLPIIVWIEFIFLYFLSFYLIYKVSRSLPLALVGLFSIIHSNIFSGSACCLPMTYIQGTAFRWLPVVFLLWLFYKKKRIDNLLFIFVLSLMSLWIIDVGIAIVLAYGLTLILLTLAGVIDVKRLIKGLMLFGAFLLIIFMVVDLFHLIFGYQSIDMLSALTKIKEYSKAGFGMLPIPTKSYFWITPLIYFGSLIYFFHKKKPTEFDQLLLLSANLTLFTSVYFVGRSHLLNLFGLAPIVLLNLFFLFALVLPSIKLNPLKNILFIACFIFFVFFPLYFRKDSAVVNVREKLNYLKKGNPFQPEMDQVLKERYAAEKKMIDENFKEKNVLILSTDDTYLLYLTNKASLLNINPLTATISQTDIDFSLQSVYKSCPQKIAVDCEVFGRCPFSWKLNYLRYPYQVYLDKITSHCQFQYKPAQCTNQLCIAMAE